MKRFNGYAGVIVAGLIWGACAEKKSPPPKKADETVEVELLSVPPGAAVLVGGRDRLGETPLKIRRRPGSRVRLHFALEGYQPTVQDLFVEARDKQALKVEMRRETGTLIVNTGFIRGAKVMVDSVYRGRSPLRVELPVGEHLLRVEKQGALTFEKRVRIDKPGQQLVVPVRVTPIKGNRSKGGKRKRRR